jgi:hypothetical protein
VRSKGFIRERLKLASLGVALDRSVKFPRIERLEPRAKPRQLARVKLFDSFLDVFGNRSRELIASSPFEKRPLALCRSRLSREQVCCTSADTRHGQDDSSDALNLDVTLWYESD